jgi:hypothetical protein
LEEQHAQIIKKKQKTLLQKKKKNNYVQAQVIEVKLPRKQSW